MALIAGMSVGCLSLPLSICDFQLSFPKLMSLILILRQGYVFGVLDCWRQQCQYVNGYGAVSATSISWQYVVVTYLF